VAAVLLMGLISFGVWICRFSALVGLKKDIRFIAAKRAQRGAVNPRSPQGRGSEHGVLCRAELHKRG